MASIANYLKGLIRDRDKMKTTLSNLTGKTITNNSFTNLIKEYEKYSINTIFPGYEYIRFCNTTDETLDLTMLQYVPFTNMVQMFDFSRELKYLPGIENLTVNNVTNMYRMFNYCENILELNLSRWNTSKVTNISNMCTYCNNLSSLNLSGWDMSNVTCGAYRTLPSCNCDISNWIISNTTNITMLCSGKSMYKINVANWVFKEPNIQLGRVFGYANTQNCNCVKTWNTENISQCHDLFFSCNNLQTLEGLENWKTGNIQNMTGMFASDTNLRDINAIQNWDFSNVRYPDMMFQYCYNLRNVPCKNWQLTNAINIGQMFAYCNNLTTTSLQNIAYMCLNARNVSVKTLLNNNANSPIYRTNFLMNSATIGSTLVTALESNGWTLS